MRNDILTYLFFFTTAEAIWGIAVRAIVLSKVVSSSLRNFLPIKPVRNDQLKSSPRRGKTLTTTEMVQCTKTLVLAAHRNTPRGGSGHWAAGGHSPRGLGQPRYLSRSLDTRGLVLGLLAAHLRRAHYKERWQWGAVACFFRYVCL